MKKFRYAQWDVCKAGVESNRVDVWFGKEACELSVNISSGNSVTLFAPNTNGF